MDNKLLFCNLKMNDFSNLIIFTQKNVISTEDVGTIPIMIDI
jgi:hypothetical protein